MTFKTLTKIPLLLAAMTAVILTVSCEPEEITVPANDSTDNVEQSTWYDSDGATYALFSVWPSRKVRFSRGNLQYSNAGTHNTPDGQTPGSWRFAVRQYDFAGYDNANISASYTGWIDLFGWGTSGWNSGAKAYLPYSYSVVCEDYQPGGDGTNGLTGSCANADWGVYNAISNGGNQPGLWRTLTRQEWGFLFGNSPMRLNKWGGATIDDTYCGIVILPDEWDTPDNLTFNPGLDSGALTNRYSIDEWTRMEENGAVFLPALGGRYGQHEIRGLFYSADYWSSTEDQEDWGLPGSNAYALGFEFSESLDQGLIDWTWPMARAFGKGVRLVRDE